MPAVGPIRVDVLLLLVAANSVPVLLSMMLQDRWASPIDGGRMLHDGQPLFGAHKTWRGLLAGTLAAGALGAGLSIGILTAAAVGFCALLGDLLSSFVKRRLRAQSGHDAPFLDQIPEALLPLLVLYQPLGLTTVSCAATIGAFVLLAMAAAKLFTQRRAPGPR
jgi:CDP-2,3-bis-(O-geranylgeranyl)-sn-glycerol synthase